MSFITIGQYFNKLQSILLFLLLVPLLIFIALYYFREPGAPETGLVSTSLLTAISFLIALVAIIISNKKIKSVRNEQGLGIKLEKYFRITVGRYSFLSVASLVMALGLYMTRSDIFTGIYVAGLILSAILWPTGRKTSNDLTLKGDERKMVYYKKDSF